MSRHKLTPFALLLALAFPGCDFFTDTVVPTSDAAPPLASAALYRDGTHEEITYGSGNPAFSAEITDPNEAFMIIAAGIDSGGTAQVVLDWEVEHSCTLGRLGQVITELKVPGYDTQDGEPGDTVSNGIWAGEVVQFSDFGNPCDAGWTWVSTTIAFRSTATDFHGNTGSHGWARVRHEW